MDRRLREALAGDQFVLYCQPIVELSSGRVCQHEILLRLLEGARRVGPGYFLAAAERFGMVQEIDRMVVSDAISILEAGGAGTLDVNLSGSSLGDPELLRLIECELSRSGIDPERLVIEVTETAAIGNMAAAIEFAAAVKGFGCRLALDDFGVGFGSLYYLKHLPFDYLKIDGEFVRDLTSSPRDRSMIKGIVALAQGLGITTIAEFVGDEATVAELREIGVDCGQGYHLGEPTLAPDVRAHRPLEPGGNGSGPAA
jgi:EAL domain-containing protein (putative c-di-GMP-specific phosphodiesterase class I)